MSIWSQSHADHTARMEARTPGLRCPGPHHPHETVEAARRRLGRIQEQFWQLRTDARARAVAAGWPGVTITTDIEVSPWDDAPDPIGDFMRDEVARRDSVQTPCVQIERTAA